MQGFLSFLKLSPALIAILLATTVPVCGQAQVTAVQIATTGALSSVVVNTATKQLDFYAISKGNNSSTITTELAGPAGTKAVVEAKFLQGDIKKALASAAGWYPIALKSIASKNYSTGSSQSSSAEASTVCPGVPDSVFLQLKDTLIQYGVSLSDQESCEMVRSATGSTETEIGNTYTSPVSLNLGQTGSLGFLQKNACLGSGIKTLIRIRVDLSKVPTDQLAASPSVGVGFKEYPFTGSRAASIKPTSEGKFAPRPLLLMSSLGGYGGSGESARAVAWKGNKPAKAVAIGVSDYVYYRGLVLSRIVASKLLTGGKATFELTNGQRIYGVCLSRSATRQRVNGYPGN